MIELGNYAGLARLMMPGYPTYSGHTLERYSKRQLAESGGFRDIGLWREPKGNENQIDIVALRMEKNEALAVEVKRKRENFRMTRLEEKVKHLKEKAMPAYSFELKCLSLEDM